MPIPKNNLVTASVAASLLVLSGCASSPNEIQAQYVSPVQYQSYNCNQLSMEMSRVGQKTAQLHASIEKNAQNDKAAMGVGMVLFWPALFLLEGDGPEAQEYARLKGEYEAMHKAAVKRECMLAKMPPSPEEIIQKKAEQKQAATEEQVNEGKGVLNN